MRVRVRVEVRLNLALALALASTLTLSKMACVSTAYASRGLVPGGSTKSTWLAHCRLVPLALCFELRSSKRGDRVRSGSGLGLGLR